MPDAAPVRMQTNVARDDSERVENAQRLCLGGAAHRRLLLSDRDSPSMAEGEWVELEFSKPSTRDWIRWSRLPIQVPRTTDKYIN